MELAATPMGILEQFKAKLQGSNTLVENKDYRIAAGALFINLHSICSKIQADKEYFQYMLELRKHANYAGRGAIRFNNSTLYLPKLKL